MIRTGLGLARIQRGDLLFGGTRFRAARAALGKPGIDCCGALAERFDGIFRHARNLKERIFPSLNPITQLGNTMG